MAAFVYGQMLTALLRASRLLSVTLVLLTGLPLIPSGRCGELAHA